jgi:hypothetical protein
MLSVPERPHPNDVDRKRIERALHERKRYRYVEPQVSAATDGYRVTSPCCSRNIDAAGGVIDIAFVQYVQARDSWRLYRMDHKGRQWVLFAEIARLRELLQQLNEDPQRIFWP